ncbi:hypothetical protein [Steroidobacter sp.]|uniref:hypothetical protein n=1 Tax=Steroidobacter sp. TaxID=1978227 RepID=UPI001A507C7D|nr:hypothetical protein [Steroidobacter sp.]MBL8266988.1 hypothetical protein [Steroidobacter sp.]
MKHCKALAAILVVEHRTHQNPLALTAPVVLDDDDLPSLGQLAKLRLGREPVLVAWGGGRDSTALIIELLARRADWMRPARAEPAASDHRPALVVTAVATEICDRAARAMSHALRDRSVRARRVSSAPLEATRNQHCCDLQGQHACSQSSHQAPCGSSAYGLID